MEDSADMTLEVWARNHDISPDTLRFLKEEGFASMRMLSRLTPEEIEKSYQTPRLLPLAQCLALKEAITELAGKTTVSVKPLPEVLDRCEQESLAGSHLVQNPEPTSMAQGETFRLMMLGKTGAGKSTTGNTILGGKIFSCETRFDSVTDECELKRSTRSGITIEVVDSPGLYDTRKSHESIAVGIARSVACMHPGPNAFLYVVKISRFTEEEEGVYTRVIKLFDKTVIDYTILVFTGGDALPPGEKIENILLKAPENLRQILRACKNRFVVFDNTAKNTQPQVDLLLRKVRALMAENGGMPYTCPKYFKIGDRMEEEVQKRMYKAEKKNLQKKRFVQELQSKTRESEEEVEKVKEEFERRELAREKEMKEEEEIRKAELKSMKEMLEKQKLSEEQRRQETEAFMHKLEKEREEQKRRMDEERKREQENIRKKEEEMQEMMTKMKTEQKKQQEEMARAHEEELKNLKDEIAGKTEPGILEQFGSLMNIVTGVMKAVDTFKSFVGLLASPDPDTDSEDSDDD